MSRPITAHDCGATKEIRAARGLPVIDKRDVPFDLPTRPAARGPMVAVGQPPIRRHGTRCSMRRLLSPRRHARPRPHFIGPATGGFFCFWRP